MHKHLDTLIYVFACLFIYMNMHRYVSICLKMLGKYAQYTVFIPYVGHLGVRINFRFIYYIKFNV